MEARDTYGDTEDRFFRTMAMKISKKMEENGTTRKRPLAVVKEIGVEVQWTPTRPQEEMGDGRG